MNELRKAVTSRTKMIVINTPHNPIGKVFTREELEPIAALAKEKDLLVLSDEVYETLIYRDSVSKHVSIGKGFSLDLLLVSINQPLLSPPQLHFQECMRGPLPLAALGRPSRSR